MVERAGQQVAKDTSILSPGLAGADEPYLPPDSVVFGRSRAMDVIRVKIQKVAGTNVPVLIQGESGTGKEVLARLLHFQAPWSDGPFVKVCCPAIPSTLLESELFGYERGAFTGAYGMKPGRIELANRGTLFLDEISELEMGLQAKLLQLLQDGQFSRIGAQEDKRVEVRVVCATNRHLEKEIEAGTFRLDLFYRVNVLDMQLPPLRERREDIPDLVGYFLQNHGAMFKSTPRPISPGLMEALKAYDWPGNIRQLENLVKRYVILGSEEEVARDLVAGPPSSTFEPQIPIDGPISLKKITQQAVTEIERKVILRTLQAHHWNRKRAARALCISYRSLLYKIRDAGLSSPGSLYQAKIATEV
ncbi:MAG TPA: sigma-54 dependent transcriptional regulator [Terriglobia bacterium]|nr:sigma-54 dependent transcriptional regulator [Terriglobia bacterium]